MMWDTVIKAWVTLLNADTELATLIGRDANNVPRIYPASAGREVTIPSIEYFVVSDIEDETFNPITVQVDYWATNMTQAAAIERRLRRITHRETPRPVGGITMATRYLESRSHEYTAKPGVVHRSIDFLFEPPREMYAS